MMSSCIELLKFTEIDVGLQKCELSLEMLYHKEELKSFMERWELFSQSCGEHSKIFSVNSNVLTYTTESLIPHMIDDRYPVLLIFGNPATQSISSKMFFAYEGTKHEHRIWSALRETKYLKIYSDDKLFEYPIDMRNSIRKDEIYGLKYKSDFRIGMTVFYSMPSRMFFN